MRSQICKVCLKSEILCKACQDKLDSNVISNIDIEVSRFLYKLEDKIKSLQNAELIKVIDGNVIILVSKKGDGGKFVGKEGFVVKLLAKQFNKPIKVVELAEIKEFVENLLSPISISGINIVFTPEGEKYRIRINKKQKLSVSEQDFVDLIKNIFNKPAEIILE